MSPIHSFVGREAELSQLEGEWTAAAEGVRLVSLIGRRRVGKTRLVRHWLAASGVGERGLYLYLQPGSDLQMRLRAARAVAERFDVALVGEPSWEAIFRTLFEAATRDRLALIIDEFQRFLNLDKGVPALLQGLVDEYEERARLLLVLTGSAVGMMERCFEAAAPLYGRRTANLQLVPFGYGGVREWLSLPELEAVPFYGVLGGTPRYLQAATGGDLRSTIQKQILEPTAPLHEEPELLLATSLQETATYFELLAQIAAGKGTRTELSHMVDVKATSLTYYLRTLEDELQLVRRVVPVTEAKPARSRMGRYVLADHFFRFWFRFVYPHQGRLAMGQQAEVAEEIEQALPDYLAWTFEQVVREAVAIARFPFPAGRLGSWWNRRGDQVDVVALDTKGGQMLLGAVKWRNEPAGVEVVEGLLAKADLIPWRRNRRKVHFLLVAKAGFTPRAAALMEAEGITGWGPRVLAAIFDSSMSAI